MQAHKSGYRVKIITITATVFVALWVILLSLLPDGSSPVEAAPHPFILIGLTLAGTLGILWFALGSIDGEIIAKQAEYDRQMQAFSETAKTATKDVERARDSIELANKSRHEFLSTMSRELRTPLNTVIGYSTLLYQNRKETFEKKKMRRYAFDINKAAMHLLMIVNDILDISHLGSGTSDLRIEKVSIFKLLESCHYLTEIRGTKPGLAIVYDLPKKDFKLACDPARMSQILLNLISNAITFTDPPGIITVTVRETDDDYVEFTVKDEGIGIPVDEIENVLQRFGRVNSLTYSLRNQDSTGLGLTLVQELTRMHDGHFSLRSTEDVGTTVSVKIPNDLMVNTDTSFEEELIHLKTRHQRRRAASTTLNPTHH